MIDFILNNKEILSFGLSVLGILLALAFGGIRAWRSQICLEYESHRDVAINILRDRFVQRTSNHYSAVADERNQGAAVEEIYKRPEQQDLIRELARDLKRQNSVKSLFRRLARASQASFGFVWGAIILILVGIPVVCVFEWYIFWIFWVVIFGALILGFIIAVSIMHVLDARFFRLVHSIIEPEGE